MVCLPYCVQNSQEFKNVEKQIKETQDGIIQTNEVNVPFYAKRFVLYWIYPEKSDYAFIYNNWYNSMLMRFYGLQNISLIFIPEGFMKDVHEDRVGKNFDLSTPFPFYACQWEHSDAPLNIKYILQESRWASVPILNKMERFSAKEIVATNWCLLDIESTKYLFVKKNTMIQDRVIDIEYE